MSKLFPAVIAVVAMVAGGIVWFEVNPAASQKNIAALFPMGAAFEFEPPTAGSYDLPVIKPTPDGSVLTVEGEQQALSDVFSGQISLVSFVYFMCGDTDGCPLANATLFDIYGSSKLAPILRDNVQLLTISFDPERDTVAAIEAFSYPMLNDTEADQKIAWHVFTTQNEAELQPILDGFGQVVDRPDDQEQLKHLLRMFLVDREGNIRNIYGLGLIDPRLIMTDIETLLIEEGTL